MRIGVDLGGTKIEAVAMDGAGRVVERRRRDTPSHSYRATLDAIVTLVGEIETATGTRARVGVGTPGAVSPATGCIKNANSTCLNGHPLHRDLARALGREARIANDANCFTLSEAVDGAGAGSSLVFGVIVGTGTGGGLAVSGRVLTGRNAIAGEWGHNALPWPEAGETPGPRCYCGRRGCVETFLSGPGMAREFREETGVSLPPAEIVARAATDRRAERCLARYERRMAKALAQVVNIFDPDVIVLGGGLSRVERLYDRVPRLWGEFVFSDRVDTRLLPPVHGDASGVRGAAWLWPAGNRSSRDSGCVGDSWP